MILQSLSIVYGHWSHLKRTFQFDMSLKIHTLILLRWAYFFSSPSSIFYCVLKWCSRAFRISSCRKCSLWFDLLLLLVFHVAFHSNFNVCFRSHCVVQLVSSLLRCSHLDFYYLNLLRNEQTLDVAIAYLTHAINKWKKAFRTIRCEYY